MTATRLDTFLKTNQIKPAALARASGVSRQHLLRLRKGTADPTRRVMVALTTACSRIVMRRAHTSELFDLEKQKA